MPSERGGSRDAARQALGGWLSSQGLGVLCGQASVWLLALGSVVLAATRDGASARIAMDDMRGFFAPPSPVHFWFYLLVPVLGLYALNIALATLLNVVRKWRSGVRAPRSYAAAVIHVAFLTGLLAHAIGGFAGSDPGPLLVGPSWRDIGGGRQARVTALEVEPHPDGSTKQIHASVEVRANGATSLEELRYNRPISRALGSQLLLLLRPRTVPVARLARGHARCQVEAEMSCQLGDLRAELLFLHPPAREQRSPVARIRALGDGGRAEELWLVPGHPKRLSDGSVLLLEGIEARPAILLQRRHAPGNPWALLASALLVLGLVMMWRRFLPPKIDH